MVRAGRRQRVELGPSETYEWMFAEACGCPGPSHYDGGMKSMIMVEARRWIMRSSSPAVATGEASIMP